MEKGKLIGQGRTAEIFEWDTNKILKLFRKEMPKEFVDNEYASSLNVGQLLNFIPRTYDMLEIDNRYGIVYEKINGKTMMSIIASKPWTAMKEARRLAELHRSIQREVDFELPSFKAALKYNISKTDLLQEDIKTKIYDYIDKLEDANILCHGDFHPDNILITNEGAEVIDWMTAMKGNPLADVARTSVILKYGDIPEKSYIVRKMINFARNKFYSEYINHYLKISGASLEQIQKWEMPIAAARLIEWLPENEKQNLIEFINKTL